MPVPFSHELQARLRELLESTDPVRVQNALMAAPDREVALAISRLDEIERESTLAKVSAPKAERIRDEIDLCSKRRVANEHLNGAMQQLIAALTGRRRPPTGRRSYFRPR